MKPLNPNSMIQGRYLIVQPIGKGGMGEVYLAVDQRLGSAVALKRTFFSDDSTLGSAFEREARILARLRHPVLPKVIDHFAENGDQFLVMEHITGDDIAKRLESANKPFPVSWVMFWSDQMLDALAYLHSHEPPIVHRDIKPQNLKLTDDNHIVLLDFGLSKDFDSKSSGLNSASVAGYSPHFASMEQIRGTGTDARSDLYSLAATLYQMLTNTVPPDALTRADSMLGGKGDPIKPLNEINPEVAPAISDVILKAVAIRQDERFGTAVEMQKALRRAFSKEKNDPRASEKPTVSVDSGRPNPPPVPVPAAREPSIETPEMETQIRIDTPVPLDQTLQLPSSALPDAKQSELKTAVFNVAGPDEDGSDATPDVPSIEVVIDPTVHEEPVGVAPVAFQDIAASTSAPTAPEAHRNIAPIPVKAKKSSAGLIVGILIAMLFFGGVGSAAIWFLVVRSEPTNSGFPTPAPANAATPAPSPAVLTETNTETNSNTNSSTVAETGDPSNENSNVNAAATGTSSTKVTTPVATKTSPAKAPANPAGKSTPKPKGKDDRTVILQ